MSVRKYRMWDGKEMHQNHEIKHYELGVLQGTSYKMMGCTGLSDKQGTEIYEGDIVERDNEVSRHGKFEIERVKDKVKYVPSKFICGALTLSDFQIKSFNLEVIGNIYENKELLEK